ncbi:MAG TPA: serine/threonine-protein kinase [Burkholderiaceae bacterium]|nr:serine/threonine-protein kinase [Burkholderiaceae bacterium]
MTLPPASPPSRADDGFAATVAEDMLLDDDEASPGDERALVNLPTIGHVGRYALKHQLGAGGLGTVYAALDPLLSRVIAVKTLRIDDIAADQREAFGNRLLAEARAAAGLNHPHIVTVYDAGLAPEGVYIAMERLRGRDLRELLADGWRPDPVQAARIAKRVAEALAYAHGHGVVHCDVKPANVFMIGRTQPKVLDFGIARVAQESPLELTIDVSAGATVPPPDLASPYYAAPEHLRGEQLDARCDVYGLGLVLYEMLTGRRAFDGVSLETIRKGVLEAEVPSVRQVNDDVDEVLSGIVARAMARDPAERYRSARQLARALRDWISDETNGVGHAHTLPRRGRPWVWAAGATVGVATLALWALSSPRAPEPVATAQAAKPVVALPAPAPVRGAEAPVVEAAVPPPVAAPAAAAKARPRDEAARPRERSRPVVAVDAAPRPLAAPVQGVVQLAVTPWGNVEIDGRSAGTTPPLARLTLPVGTHQITIRNEDFAPFTTSVIVSEDKPVTLRHRFGS